MQNIYLIGKSFQGVKSIDEFDYKIINKSGRHAIKGKAKITKYTGEYEEPIEEGMESNISIWTKNNKEVTVTTFYGAEITKVKGNVLWFDIRAMIPIQERLTC